jgi:hypothetical protein
LSPNIPRERQPKPIEGVRINFLSTISVESTDEEHLVVSLIVDPSKDQGVGWCVKPLSAINSSVDFVNFGTLNNQSELPACFGIKRVHGLDIQ